MLALDPLAPHVAPLDAGERFALDLLLDLSCVLRLDAAPANDGVVRLRLVSGSKVADEATLHWLRPGATGSWLTAADGEVLIQRDALRALCDIAGGVAEQRSTARDRHQRVPSSANALVRAGDALERQPLVSRAARALAAAVVKAAGRRPCFGVAPWPNGRRWAAALTHDLDVVDWWPAFTALRIAELTAKGQLGQALAVVAAAAGTGGRDVVWRGVQSVLAAEAAHDVRSSWFVLCGIPTLATARAGDLTYDPDGPLARRIVEAVRAGGHELGLHGSFRTSDEPAMFAEQRRRLADIANATIPGVRQHYLRMQPASTPGHMAAAGFTWDSTMGFADRNGFRLGVADVIPAWSDTAQAPVALDEAPFCWMDRAMSKYQGVEEPDAWIEEALALAEECRAVQGLFVGIWHPNLTPALGYPGAPAAYARLVAALVTRDAHIAPLGELVAWRRARRAVRAAGLGADGMPVLRATDAGVVIERLAVGEPHDGA